MTPCGASHIRFEIVFIWVSAESSLTGVSVLPCVCWKLVQRQKDCHCRVSLGHTVLNT